MNITLEALTTFSYDGRVIALGQTFLARSASDAKVLTLTKKAKHRPTPQVRIYATATVEPESDQTERETVSTVDEPRKKRQYRRRDLTAESE